MSDQSGERGFFDTGEIPYLGLISGATAPLINFLRLDRRAIQGRCVRPRYAAGGRSVLDRLKIKSGEILTETTDLATTYNRTNTLIAVDKLGIAGGNGVYAFPADNRHARRFSTLDSNHEFDSKERR
jgi:hypothetical protein